MPELPEVEAVRRELMPHVVGVEIVDVELRRPDLRAPFPRRFRERLRGRVVSSLDRRAKHLLARLSSGDTLVMHLGMSGSFTIATTQARDIVAPDAHDHVVFHLGSGTTVTFNDPRRFGSMTLLTPGQLAAHPVISRLGPEPLSDEFDAGALARACRGRRTSLKAVLLDQRLVAGLGNIYASEALHVAGLSPRRRASTVATRTGAPRPAAIRLAAAVKKVLSEAVARQTGASYRSARFRVYEREGERCRRSGCSGVIVRYTQGGRSTYACPVCQR